MNIEHLDKMVNADKNGKFIVSSRTDLKPVYFNDESLNDISKKFGEIIETCRSMWTVLGYTGLISPWHESDPIRQLNFQKKNLQKWFKFLEDNDISVRSYCIICCSISKFDKHARPALLLVQNAHKSWINKLRKYAGSRSRLDEIADLILYFLELQIRHMGRAYINSNTVIKIDSNGKGKCLDTYHRINDRINQLNTHNINCIEWMENKFEICYNSLSDHRVYINTIINVNGFDPNLDELSGKLSDKWMPVKRFLGLSNECEFPDEFIPKGWNVSSEDPNELEKIVRITGDGFYYYKDGTQRRGKYHYASNRYFIIKCDYSNFDEFKNKWHQINLMTAKPTWDEYNKWARYPGVWDETGKSLIHTKDIKWRK